MKKIGIINQPVSAVIASLGHTDTLVIADAGLPIPAKVQRIDLALTAGVPGFIETLKTVLTELQVEGAILAEEVIDANPEVYTAVMEVLGDTAIDTVSHQTFKEQTKQARAVIRTGEITRYANIILVAGMDV